MELDEMALPWQGENCFHVAVVGTMSSGKSTLIDALLGTDCMPSANMACTSKIISICQQGDMKKLIGVTVSDDGSFSQPVQATKDNIKEWNQDNHIRRIILSGKSRRWGRSKPPFLVLHDTPGPNDSRHPELAIEYIFAFLRQNPVNLILYVIDGLYNGTVDQKELFSKIREKHKMANSLFVINKLDDVDTEKENICNKLEHTLQDLKAVGFLNPSVLPFSAKAARLCQLALAKYPMTSSEQSFLDGAIKNFDDLTCFLPSTLKKHRRGRGLLALGRDAEEIELRVVMKKTGLIALRAIIQKKINDTKEEAQ